jgi:hypothetical protein
MAKVIASGLNKGGGIGQEVRCYSCGCKWAVEEGDPVELMAATEGILFGRRASFKTPCPECDETAYLNVGIVNKRKPDDTDDSDE